MKSISQFSVTFKIHNKSTIIEISKGRVVPSQISQKGRGNITEFSHRSERRMRITLEDNLDVVENFTVFTYPKEFPCDGRKVKRDIDVMNRRLQRKGFQEGIWGIEFQKRGAPHINLVTKEPIDKAWLSQAWFEVVGSGDLKHLKAGTRTEKVRSKEEAVSYMVGYMHKRSQKDVPPEYKNVGRFWGYWGDLVKREKSTYTYRFKTDESLETFLKPVVNEYERKIAEWGKKKGKAYTWTYKGKSFTMWSGSEFINKFIEGGSRNEEKEKEDSAGNDDIRGLCRRNHRLTFRIQRPDQSVFRGDGLG